MGKRLTQLIARYLGAALLALAGWLSVEVDPEAVAQVAGAAAAAIAAVVAFAVDLVIHRLGTGSVLAPPGPPEHTNA